MALANTRVDKIVDGIYRISTPVPPSMVPGGFTFNQFLIVDDDPLLFHTGLHRIFPRVREAIESVIPTSRLRYIGVSHFEADECGALNELLDVAPMAVPLCGKVGAAVSINDVASRQAHILADGEVLSLGEHSVQWFDTPQLPHAWDCGFLFESHTRTLLCGDLFTQSGADLPYLTEFDILEMSEAFRTHMDYFSHTSNARAMLERLAATKLTTLACMHGSAWKGDGEKLLLALADALTE